MFSKLIYRIDIDCYKKHIEDIDYYTKDVYEARLMHCFEDDSERNWAVCKVFYSNSVESVFIEANHYKKKLTGEWK